MVNEAKQENVDEIIKFATAAIPLKDLATGPKDSLGLGPHFAKYESLDHVITFLGNYPAKGNQIILTALDSPVTRNRNMAIKALHKWGKGNWPESIATKLEELSRIEPNSSTKEDVLRVLNGQDVSY